MFIPLFNHERLAINYLGLRSAETMVCPKQFEHITVLQYTGIIAMLEHNFFTKEHSNYSTTEISSHEKTTYYYY